MESNTKSASSARGERSTPLVTSIPVSQGIWGRPTYNKDTAVILKLQLTASRPKEEPIVKRQPVQSEKDRKAESKSQPEVDFLMMTIRKNAQERALQAARDSAISTIVQEEAVQQKTVLDRVAGYFKRIYVRAFNVQAE